MSRFRIYIAPFIPIGTSYADYIEVTDDCDATSIGSIQETIDRDEYEVGIFKFNQFRLVLNNETGKYSDVGAANTIFAYKRSGSLVKITWEPATNPPICGIATCGVAVLSDPTTVFVGLLNDESLALNATSQRLDFQALGLESIFENVKVNYSSISNGDLISEVIYTILNQTPITNLMTVISGNISVGTDVTIDDKSTLENKTVKEALDDLLFAGNAVLYIVQQAGSQVIRVADRTPNPAVSKTFYGQGSSDGPEDIINLSNVRNGLNKVYNFWTWRETTNVQSDTTSTDLYGIKKNQISNSLITNSTKIDSILSGLLAEFKDIKQELEITVPITVDSLALFILDRIAIDYPTVFISADDSPVPVYGGGIYGSSKYPLGKWTLTIPITNNYKILSRNIITAKQTIIFKIKLI